MTRGIRIICAAVLTWFTLSIIHTEILKIRVVQETCAFVLFGQVTPKKVLAFLRLLSTKALHHFIIRHSLTKNAKIKRHLVTFLLSFCNTIYSPV